MNLLMTDAQAIMYDRYRAAQSEADKAMEAHRKIRYVTEFPTDASKKAYTHASALEGVAHDAWKTWKACK